MKRAKRAKKGAAKALNAKKGRPGKPSPGDEPFFLPFTGLKVPKKDARSQAKGGAKPDAKGGAKPDAKGGAKPDAKSPVTPTKPEAKTPTKGTAASTKKEARTAEAEAPAQPVDPDTFAIYMAGVRVLDHPSNRIPKTANRIERAAGDLVPRTDLDAPARAQMRSLVTEGLRFESFDDGDRIEGRRMDVDPRELRRLRKGQYAVDGTIDLHGMSLAEAREAVTAFVRKRSSEGDRVITIIHGKGTHSPRGLGVLRGEIGAWLSDGRAARHVLAFATAPDDQGGTGAVLVLLTR